LLDYFYETKSAFIAVIEIANGADRRAKECPLNGSSPDFLPILVQ